MKPAGLQNTITNYCAQLIYIQGNKHFYSAYNTKSKFAVVSRSKLYFLFINDKQKHLKALFFFLNHLFIKIFFSKQRYPHATCQINPIAKVLYSFMQHIK